MANEGWTTSYCLSTPRFPKLLYAAMTRLGILDHPEYVAREYEHHGTNRCEVIIYVGASNDFPDPGPWVVSTTGFRLEDTYQVVARKALRYLCQIYERQICGTPMRFFPPFVRNNSIWEARMRTLEGDELRESDPTTVFMANYLLSLDKQYDKQAAFLRKCIRRAEKAERQTRSLQVQLAEAKAKAAIAESREAAATESLKQAKDQHTQRLNKLYLVTRAKRRTLTLEERECPILDGIPIASMGSIQEKTVDALSVPPPTDASLITSDPSSVHEDKESLPLTQPSQENGSCSHPIMLKESSSTCEE